jgi:hypothetical protein
VLVLWRTFKYGAAATVGVPDCRGRRRLGGCVTRVDVSFDG